MKQGQAELRVKNKEIIRNMLDNGATLEEMVEVTGYRYQTVRSMVVEIRAEIVKEENLTLAKHPKPDMPIVEIDGKKYRDVTDMFLSSEWEEGGENYGIYCDRRI